ncbi:hypothetical protein ACAX46_004449 [Providencia rettgeri]
MLPKLPTRSSQPETKDKIIDLTMNNVGIRDTARALYISINAVFCTLKNSRRSR